MKILVLGAGGMLGHKIFETLSKYKNFDVYGTVTRKDSFNGCLPISLEKKIIENIDALRYESVKNLIDFSKADVVINCVGIIKQKKDNSDVAKMIYLNALFPHYVAEVCKTNGSRFITIATDCVFDGSKGNYLEDDLPTCHDIYGMSKYLGEVTDGVTLTLRTSIIGHELKANISLLDWFLNQKTESVKGYKNAIFSGFTTLELSKIIAEKIIPNNNLNGLYQISTDPISKYDLLCLVAKIYKKNIKVIPDEFVKINRSLNSNILRQKLEYVPPAWEELVSEMYNEFLESKFYIEKRKIYAETNSF